MRCLDSTFVVDLLRGDVGARKRAEAMGAASERACIPAPATAEVLVGAQYRGGLYLRKALELLASLDVIPTDATVAARAGELGAELLRRGARLSALDLLIAATAEVHSSVLLTRDSGFSAVPGLAVETY
jgi:predicted nucleic acid-binding protein